MCYNPIMSKNVTIWAKIMQDGKVFHDIMYTGDMFYDEDSFHECLRDICDKLDIPTPVLLPQHFANFIRFHNCRFYEWDFVESFPYERFVIEDATN